MADKSDASLPPLEVGELYHIEGTFPNNDCWLLVELHPASKALPAVYSFSLIRSDSNKAMLLNNSRLICVESPTARYNIRLYRDWLHDQV